MPRSPVMEAPCADPVTVRARMRYDMPPSPRRAKLAELVAAAIQQDIAALGWPVGALFGSEAHLMERYAISRATLREATRQLERHGVASMRRGSGGGLVVSQPASEAAVLALATYLELTDVSYHEIYEARELLECQVAELAAERLQDGDIAPARLLLQRLQESSGEDFAAELQLHVAIREFVCSVASNPAMGLIMEALCYVTINSRTLQQGETRAQMQAIFGEYRQFKVRLLQAVIAGDGHAAQESVREQLAFSRELIERLHGSLAKGPSSHVSSLEASPAIAIRKLYDKSAHRLAVVIARNISASGLRAGARLGAEPDLQAQHKVSRAVLREAVRTLELHAILRSRRGQNGGLIVETPDPSYTIRLSIDYLRHSGMPRHHCHLVWKSLQLAAASLAAQRLDGCGRARLQALLVRLREGEEEGQALGRELDLCIAELSGNRALALLVHVLATLADSYPQQLSRAAAQQLGELRQGLAEALLEQSASLARRYVLRYFQFLEGYLQPGCDLTLAC